VNGGLAADIRNFFDANRPRIDYPFPQALYRGLARPAPHCKIAPRKAASPGSVGPAQLGVRYPNRISANGLAELMAAFSLAGAIFQTEASCKNGLWSGSAFQPLAKRMPNA
jgi:hypothetical protein